MLIARLNSHRTTDEESTHSVLSLLLLGISYQPAGSQLMICAALPTGMHIVAHSFSRITRSASSSRMMLPCEGGRSQESFPVPVWSSFIVKFLARYQLGFIIFCAAVRRASLALWQSPKGYQTRRSAPWPPLRLRSLHRAAYDGPSWAVPFGPRFTSSA
jgi:hypothetical protein